MKPLLHFLPDPHRRAAAGYLAGLCALPLVGAGCAGARPSAPGGTDNASTVRRIYAAFGRGDVAAILSHVADDTHWDFNGGSRRVPWHQPVNGKAAVPGFLGAFGGNVELAVFEPEIFAVSGPNVAVRLRIAYTVKRTGKRVEQEQVHWWTFDAKGKVVSLRHFEDTASVIAANS